MTLLKSKCSIQSKCIIVSFMKSFWVFKVFSRNQGHLCNQSSLSGSSPHFQSLSFPLIIIVCLESKSASYSRITLQQPASQSNLHHSAGQTSRNQPRAMEFLLRNMSLSRYCFPMKVFVKLTSPKYALSSSRQSATGKVLAFLLKVFVS